MAKRKKNNVILKEPSKEIMALGPSVLDPTVEEGREAQARIEDVLRGKHPTVVYNKSGRDLMQAVHSDFIVAERRARAFLRMCGFDRDWL